MRTGGGALSVGKIGADLVPMVFALDVGYIEGMAGSALLSAVLSV